MEKRGDLPRRRDKEQNRTPQKAPLPYRIIAWACLIAILFGLGYYGSGLILKLIGKKFNISGEISTQVESTQVVSVSNMPYINEVKVFLPEGGSLSVTGYKLVPGVMEENISATLEQWISLMASKGLVDGNSRVLHVFRNGEMLYLDMNASFYSSLQKLDKDRALLFMTALLRTVIENFDPIKEVKFLTEGKDATMTAPVDLTVSWRLAPKS